MLLVKQQVLFIRLPLADASANRKGASVLYAISQSDEFNCLSLSAARMNNDQV